MNLKQWSNAQYRSAIDRVNYKREVYESRFGGDSQTLDRIDALISKGNFDLKSNNGISARVDQLSAEQKQVIQILDAIPTYGERKRREERRAKKEGRQIDSEERVKQIESLKKEFENTKDFIYDNMETLNAPENRRVRELLYDSSTRENENSRLLYKEMREIVENYNPNAKPSDPVNVFVQKE